jgi:uncharacterized protein YbjT (DUF2867 family)
MLVGCGCRGRMLAGALTEDGWTVRGTSRTAGGAAAVEATGAQGVVADPDRLGTITELIGDVTVLVWLMGSVAGEAGETVNGPRLESLLEKLVDSPVRGLVYEAAGTAPADALAAGAAMVEAASERFRIPARVLQVDPADPDAWVEEARAAVTGLLT